MAMLISFMSLSGEFPFFLILSNFHFRTFFSESLPRCRRFHSLISLEQIDERAAKQLRPRKKQKLKFL